MSLAYQIAKLAKQLCCYRANPLQFFDEAAGAILVKKGGLGTTPQLVLTDTSTYLGDPTGSASGFHSAVGGGEGNTASDANATVGGGEGNTASQANTTVGGGQGNTASGDNATVAGGSSNQATAQSATVGGGEANIAAGYAATVIGGSENTANGDFSVAIGTSATARHHGEFAQAVGSLNQRGQMVMGAQTTNATPAQATLNGSAFIVPTDNEVWRFRAGIAARCVAASKAWAYDLEFAVTNFGGTLTQLGTTDVGFDKKTGSTTWAAAVYVSGDNVSITVTGAVGETVDWTVDFWYVKVG